MSRVLPKDKPPDRLSGDGREVAIWETADLVVGGARQPVRTARQPAYQLISATRG
jgi:hypothetical protein